MIFPKAAQSIIALIAILVSCTATTAFVASVPPTTPTASSPAAFLSPGQLFSSSKSEDSVKNKVEYDYDVPDDCVVHIKPKAMRRLRELRSQQLDNDEDFLTLRMGVRSGGCSGMSYVMDFADKDSIQADDDQVDLYEKDRIQCVVDAKSMLYLYGLELDYSTELIGGGFQFFNPNAEESCGCGSSFGV